MQKIFGVGAHPTSGRSNCPIFLHMIEFQHFRKIHKRADGTFHCLRTEAMIFGQFFTQRHMFDITINRFALFIDNQQTIRVRPQIHRRKISFTICLHQFFFFHKSSATKQKIKSLQDYTLKFYITTSTFNLFTLFLFSHSPKHFPPPLPSFKKKLSTKKQDAALFILSIAPEKPLRRPSEKLVFYVPADHRGNDRRADSFYDEKNLFFAHALGRAKSPREYRGPPR